MSRWAAYKYRFFPWQVANFAKHSNTLTDAVSESEACETLLTLFHGLTQCRKSNDRFIREQLGYNIALKPSSIHGNGVFVTAGHIKAHTIVGLYPGTLYQPGDPILLQSVCNSFVFKCKDGMFIDGKPTGISRMVYNSCTDRSRLGAYVTSDKSWLGAPTPGLNPLCCGQYVNNAASSVTSSVTSNNATSSVTSNNATSSVTSGVTSNNATSSATSGVTSNNATSSVTSNNATISVTSGATSNNATISVTSGVTSNNATRVPYISNTTRLSNVCYQEVDLDLQRVRLNSRCWVPVVPYSDCTRYIRLVVLVSLCELKLGTELLSDYFTVVR